MKLQKDDSYFLRQSIPVDDEIPNVLISTDNTIIRGCTQGYRVFMIKKL